MSKGGPILACHCGVQASAIFLRKLVLSANLLKYAMQYALRFANEFAGLTLLMSSPKFFLSAIWATFLWLFSAASLANAGEKPSGILLVNTLGPDPFTTQLISGVERSIATENKGRQLYVENLDALRHTSFPLEETAEYLQSKYRDTDLQGVIFFGHIARQLAEMHPNLLKNVTKVTDNLAGRATEVQSDLVYVDYLFSPSSFVDEALRLTKPETVYLLGSSRDPVGAAGFDALKAVLASRSLNVEILHDQNGKQLEQRLNSIGSDSIVIAVPRFSPIEWGLQPIGEMQRLVAQLSVPVLSTVSVLMGTGILGGKLFSVLGLGETLGTAALGGDPSLLNHPALYDGEALSRHGFTKGDLPSDVELSRPLTPTLWEAYRYEAATVFGMLVGLGAYSLYLRRRVAAGYREKLNYLVARSALVSDLEAKNSRIEAAQRETDLLLATAEIVLFELDIESGTAQLVAGQHKLIPRNQPFDHVQMIHRLSASTEVRQALKNTFASDNASYTARVQFETGDKPVWGQVVTGSQYKREGRAKRLFARLDVTELQEKNEQLRSATEKQKELFAVIGYELRTPVAAIDMVLNDTDLDLAERLTSIREISRSLLHILEDLRTVVAPERAIEAKAVIANPVDIVQRALAPLAPLLKENQIQLNLQAPVGVEPVWLKDQALRQLVTNLVKNAALHSGGSKVWVSLEAASCGEHLEIQLAVADNGIGIPSNQVAKVFSAFGRGDTSKDGSGLGLYSEAAGSAVGR
ncbi:MULTISPECIES: HAMP domain-containing sensor histidine kinase [unclassified Marinobacterium]|uniref:sensor histidine kinase n=1 Tax=unclassified Marinobacterium TaxID=2644139 RepID=UPI001568DE0B|nr:MULTISPECIES: HAMP domain-containing sensor histidine kinase [unclassified Marinobacterium]NRP26851.1 putative sensor histidine kinase TcrY [Marinobacterium sp. xm-d-420]NRP56990.1 putative sensor histidine kinase TcrY [Marinobacterium sp. xm-d-510]NRP97760.1 putative sensor histidine kinase TcrY [Marinobacterium sp. xm-a-127]